MVNPASLLHLSPTQCFKITYVYIILRVFFSFSFHSITLSLRIQKCKQESGQGLKRACNCSMFAPTQLTHVKPQNLCMEEDKEQTLQCLARAIHHLSSSQKVNPPTDMEVRPSAFYSVSTLATKHLFRQEIALSLDLRKPLLSFVSAYACYTHTHTNPLTLGRRSVWDSRGWRLCGEEFTVDRWGSC